MRTNRFNTGKPFETLLDTILLQYQSQGIMRIKKVEPPTKTLGGGSFKRTIHLENPFLDYVGVWSRMGGRAVCFEAKSTAKPRLPIKASGGLTENQCAAIYHWHGAGAVTFFLWQNGDEVRLGLLRHLVAAYNAGEKSVKWQDMIAIPRGTGFMVWDFEKLMQEIWGNK